MKPMLNILRLILLVAVMQALTFTAALAKPELGVDVKASIFADHGAVKVTFQQNLTNVTITAYGIDGVQMTKKVVILAKAVEGQQASFDAPFATGSNGYLVVQVSGSTAAGLRASTRSFVVGKVARKPGKITITKDGRRVIVMPATRK